MMISVNEAEELIRINCIPSIIKGVKLEDAYNRVLAEDIISPIHTPEHNQSAMDGYAMKYDESLLHHPYTIIAEIQAGSDFHIDVKSSECVRIFTGAFVPESCDTVIMQEKVERKKDKILLLDSQLKQGSNVRPQGSQSKQGECVLKAGTLLRPAAIAFIATLGISKVKVYAAPAIHLIITGKELVKSGSVALTGQVYECNSFGLKAALQAEHIYPDKVFYCDDRLDEIKAALEQSMHKDIVVISGGISVGDYDFVAEALSLCGVDTIFYKVKQKPGKPIFFGKRNNTLVFALPGNPASVLVCYYQYVLPVIKQMMNKEPGKLFTAPLQNSFKRKAGLTQYLKGFYSDDGLIILEDQNSYQLNTFAVANCLIVLSEQCSELKEGDILNYLPIN
ncbi:MAG TPA: molybdopterin molybdotransferase MoeA [Bacteroidia bacterium]|nr:molybdopterin molybdotransferase MoeA [Bacteroidia bacterium]HNT79938.1 molybdopterin molybdotransferase MoeA [Bacteroidia bacterium]